MSHWWRAHDEAVDDPKLQLLPDALLRAWFNVMCLSSANGGIVPPVAHVAFKLRMTTAKALKALDALTAAELLDKDGEEWRPHNWDERQFKSDVSTDRVKQFRKRRGNVSSTVPRNVSGTPPDTDSEAETERKEDVAADAAPASSVAPYAFESGVIRLKQKDFDQWKQAYSHLDLGAELLALTEWASTQARWFPAVSGALAKRNREMGLRLEQRKGEPEFKWKSGIPGVV